jgi:hypothetical protein
MGVRTRREMRNISVAHFCSSSISGRAERSDARSVYYVTLSHPRCTTLFVSSSSRHVANTPHVQLSSSLPGLAWNHITFNDIHQFSPPNLRDPPFSFLLKHMPSGSTNLRYFLRPLLPKHILRTISRVHIRTLTPLQLHPP